MDLETENRIAAILMKEAAELRREAEKEGVLAYLKQPTVRGRPNSRFLTATVRGVQQANKAVEVNEMWRARQKELELDKRIIRGGRSRDESRSSRPSHRDSVSTPRSTSKTNSDYDDDNGGAVSCSSSQRLHNKDYNDEDEGLKEEEIEVFLQSRVKRGRGSVGSRMDETGPYLPPREDTFEKISSNPPSAWANRAVLGPEKPFNPSRSDESESEERPKKKKKKKDHSEKSRSHKNRSKDKPRDGKRKKKSRDEKRKKDGKRHRD